MVMTLCSLISRWQVVAGSSGTSVKNARCQNSDERSLNRTAVTTSEAVKKFPAFYDV